jgi:hypothetical protein
MTKREILIAICENPGWSPPEASSSCERLLAELVAEEWIISRIDGYEASPKALTEYPVFRGTAMEDPDVGDRPPAGKEPPGEPMWTTITQDALIVLQHGQRIESQIVASDAGTPALRGSMMLEMTDTTVTRCEIQVILRIRTLPLTRPQPGGSTVR